MKDLKGRAWSFEFSGKTIRTLAKKTGLSTKPLTGEDSLLQAITTDEALLMDVLWYTIEDQADAMKVTENDFFESLDGELIQQASIEWIEGYINFSPPTQRAILRKTLTAVNLKLSTAEAELQKMSSSGRIDEIVNQAVSEACTKRAAN